MADFSSTMAEMIARSRPQHAPGQQLPRMVPGPMGMKGSMKKTDVSVNADIGAIRKFFGYKTPEEKEEIAKNFITGYRNATEEGKLFMRDDEKFQSVLLEGYKQGVPGLYKLPNDDTIYIADIDMAAKIREDQPTKEVILSGAYDTPKTSSQNASPSAPAVSTGQQTMPEQLTQSTQPTNKTTFSPSAELVKNTREIAELTPEQANIYKLEAALKERQIKLAEEQTKLQQELLPVELKKYEASIKASEAQASSWRDQAHIMERQLAVQESQATATGVAQANVFFGDYLNTVAKENAIRGLGQTQTIEQMYNSLLDMKLNADATIGRIRSYTEKPNAAEYPVRATASQVESMFAARQEYKNWSGKKVDQTKMDEQDKILEDALLIYMNMLKTSGVQSKDLYKKVLDWGRKLGKTPEELIEYFGEGS